MKKVSYKLILLLLVLMFGIYPVIVSGQGTDDGKSASKSSFDKHFFLQARGLDTILRRSEQIRFSQSKG